MTPKAMLDRLESVIGISGHPRRLQEAIEIELCNVSGLPPVQAAEQAEELEGHVRNLINKRRIERESNGIFPVIVLTSASERSVAGACWVESGDSPDMVSVKRRRLQVEPLYREIRSLTFNEFEIFGSKVLKELGASLVQITPHSEDQGIDFYGVLSLGIFGTSSPPICQLAHDVTIRFAGQAKHYPNSAIGPSMIRELVGSIMLARYKLFTKETDIFKDLGLLAFNPLLAILFTTGRFTRGSIELSAKAGIIARDGEQLSVFLADRGVGVDEDDENVRFNRDKFRAWLEK